MIGNKVVRAGADSAKPADARLVFPRVILSGHAKLPQDAVAKAVWEFLSIVVSVDPHDGTVTEVDTTLVTSPAKGFVHDLLLGQSLNDPPDGVLAVVDSFYAGGAKKALLAALKQVYDSWIAWKTESAKGQGEPPA